MRNILLFFCVGLVLLASLPLVAEAQSENTELSDTVRAAILSDPRAVELSAEEVDAMVSALTEEAATQGVTPEDIVWRPEAPEEDVAIVARCGSMPLFFCTLNEAFGFDGSDIAIPIGLGLSSGILLFVIGSLLLHRHGHHPIAGSVGAPASSTPKMPM